MSSVIDVLNKLKQLPQARLSQLAVAILLIYIASILANITWMLLPGQGSGQNSGALTSPKQQANHSTGRNSGQTLSINSITSLNLFGDHQAVVVEEVPQVVEVTEAPETNLNLKLTATVAEGQRKGVGSAIIESSGEQGTYGVGDKIKATTAVVHQVFTDRVILQNGNRHETLMLDGVDYSQSGQNNENIKRASGTIRQDLPMPDRGRDQPPRNDTKAPARSSSQRAVDKRKDVKLSQKLGEQRDNLLKDPGKLADFIRVSPVRKNGELTGYRLNPSNDPELFKQAGLKPNDLAVQINGYALNDLRQAMTALRELREASEANIVVERNGEMTEILFSLDSVQHNPDDVQYNPDDVQHNPEDDERRNLADSESRDDRLN